MLLQPNYGTREQCDAFLGRSVGPWAPWPFGERCQTQSSPSAILQSRPLGAEMKYGRASHYTETYGSHLVIDGLSGGLCPHPPLRNRLLACYHGGWASLKQCWKTRDASFSPCALPIRLHTTMRILIHVRCTCVEQAYTYMDIHIASLILVTLPLPNSREKKKQLDFNQTLQKSNQQQRISYNQGILKSYISHMQTAVWFGDQLSPGGGRRRQKGINNG